MRWSVVAAAAILFVVGATCSPVDISTPATDLVAPKAEDGPTLATDLMPPPLPEVDPSFGSSSEEDKGEKKVPATLFLINIFAVKNSTGDETNDVLHNDVIEEVPDDIAEPLAVFLLVVEEEDEDHPVNLDEVAKDLEEEGFTVEKVTKDGETLVVKVDLGSVESTINKAEERDVPEDEDTELVDPATEQPPLEESGKLTKIRRKRHICLRCKLDELKSWKHGYGGGGGGGGCGGGCGGGSGGFYQQPPVQTVYQPVIVQPIQQKPSPCGGGGCGGGGGYYQPPPPPPPQPHYGGGGGGGSCSVCGGGGGGYGGHGGGGSNAHASASAQASAQASASSYGGY